MSQKASRSIYVRVALATDTALNHALNDAPNRAARLLELATMGLALQKVATASPLVNQRPPAHSAFGKPLAVEQERMANSRRIDDKLMEIWSKI